MADIADAVRCTMITAEEAAPILGVAPRTVYDLASPAGPIPCTRIKRRVTFDLNDALEYKE